MSLPSMKILNRNGEDTFFSQTLLQHIKEGNNARILWILRGIDMCQLRDSTGATLLHYAAKYGNAKFAQYLINSGANVSAITKSLVTPLMMAAENNQEEIVNLLFKANVKIFLPGDHDQYTLELALKILKFMMKFGYNYNRCKILSHKILEYGDKQIVREALPCILDLHAKSPPVGDKLLEPLLYLSRNKLPNILEELRNYDFDVNAKTSYGSTMLHYAAEFGNASSVKFLLDRGANVNALDANFHTPLRLSIVFVCRYYVAETVRERISSFLNCMEILSEHDADPQIIFWDASLIREMTEFEWNYAGENVNLFESIITRLALREVRGHEIDLPTRQEVQKVPRFQSIFSENKLHLEKIKEVFISNSVSLLDFYTVKDANFSRYALNKQLVFNVNRELKFFDKSSYCYRKLHERCSKLNGLVKLREQVAIQLNEILTEICGISIYNVADKIVTFVCDNDLYKMI